MDIGKITDNYSKIYSNNSIHKNNTQKSKKAENAEKVQDKTTITENTDNNKNMLSTLQSKFPNLSLTSGNGIAWKDNNKTNNVIIHPSILAKMENDPKAEDEYTKRLTYIEAAFKVSDAMASIKGGKVTYRVDYIDENGEVWGGAIVEYKDSLNEKLRKQAEENRKERIEKIRESANEKKEELEQELGNIKETAEEKNNLESLSKVSKTSEIERKIGTALESGSGKVLFNNEDMEAMLEEAKQKGFDRKIDVKA